MIKNALTNLALAAGSCALLYASIEFAFFPMLLPYVPLKLQPFLNTGIDVAAQSSKSSLVPRDYIAIVGDSYAKGAGDWFMDANPDRNEPCTSAHVIKDRTGVDTITYGWGGLGSLDGIAARPYCVREAFNKVWRPGLARLAEPKIILVYFYEGNDLSNNIDKIREAYTGGGYDMGRIRDEAYFTGFIKEGIMVKDQFDMCRRALDPKLTDQLIFTSFLKMIIRKNVQAPKVAMEKKSRPASTSINQAISGGRTLTLPANLQSPDMELGEEEIGLAVYGFERSLAFMMEYMKSARTVVVYVPSPLSSYNLVSRQVSIQKYGGSGGNVYDTESVTARSDMIVNLIGQAAARQGAGFVDTRGRIRAASDKEVIHGPRDWKHFNKKGYEALVDSFMPEVSKFLETGGKKAN
ncbi:MAG: hypothetical protein HZB29_08240 [Nitrospinae bacterium]|nr:hypothetical protein [Nitrospinota bacterium]